MASRIRSITAQVLAGAPTAAATQHGSATDFLNEGGVTHGASQEAQDAAFVEAQKVRKKVLESQDRLIKDGTPLEFTRFDLDLATDFQLTVPPRSAISKMLDEAYEAGRMELYKKLPGPMIEAMGDREKEIDVCLDLIRGDAQGWNQYNFMKLQEKYGDQGLESNICVPHFVRSGYGSKEGAMELHPIFLIMNSKDAEGISRKHIRKDTKYENGFFDSVIATQDNDYWREQRNHLNEAFLPLASLSRIMPVSMARAKHCAARLEELSKNNTPVDMSDFFLHETMAQMQLALMGAEDEQMERLNGPIRGAFGGRKELAKVGQVGAGMKEFMENAKNNPGLRMPSESAGGILGTETIRGPLSRAV